MLLIGIDEAGYGPRLGPLCHGYCAIRCPENTGGAAPDLWRALHPVVMRHPANEGCITVDDSKKVYTAGSGLNLLTRSIEAFLRCAAATEFSAPLFERILPAADRARLEEDAWGRGDNCGFRIADCGLVGEHVSRLRERFEMHTLSVVALGARAQSARYYNAALSESGNKADVSWCTIAEQLFAMASLAMPCESIYAVIDRQGGRKFYYGQLCELFPESMAWVESESPKASHYRLDWRGRSMRIAFLVDAESEMMPVALGSMAAKLTRELCMSRLNAFFQTHAPELKSTAGYYNDANRFLLETKALRKKLGIADHVFVRVK